MSEQDKLQQWSERLTNRQQPLRVHLIGVAGSGMSGLALLLLGMGHEVSGSDRVTSVETERLQGLGLVFSSPHTAEAVRDCDVVVYSSAIRPTNPAYAAAEAAGIPLLRRAECLAAILHTRKGIVVSGTHGKTTTSSMAAHLLREAGFKPSHYVGAEIPILGSNARWSEEGEHMVAEGDESDGTLALYHPEALIVLNVEAEHLDFYRHLDEIRAVFARVLAQTRGLVVYCAEDQVARELCRTHHAALSYGWNQADYTAVDVKEKGGTTQFVVLRRGTPLGVVDLGIPGRHNVLNALAAIALADAMGADFALSARALAAFAGAKRRFETRYLSSQLRVVDDYGHHPTEIAATLQTARSLKPQRVVVLFQPHRFSRTQALAPEFAVALQAADLVFITGVYAASETPIEGVSGETIVVEMTKLAGTRAVSVPDLAKAHHVVGNALQPGDLFITLGAGNVHEAGTQLIRDWVVREELLRLVPPGELDCRLYEPMRRHSTMLVGGPAQFWCEPQSFDAFAQVVRYCRERGIAIRVVGRGSNLIVRDGGIRGVVIHPDGGVFGEVRVEQDLVIAGAGARLKKVASVAQAASLGGFEWMEGVPGNVGGALRMNAGAMGVEMMDQVVSVTLLDEDGVIRTRYRSELEVQYRNVPQLRRQYALQVVLTGEADDPAAIAGRWQASREKRRLSQPIKASAGCTFKNPLSQPAGKLIDELGLKGWREGAAEVSAIHGNFIVNTGGATAEQVLRLIERVKQAVREQRGVELELEVMVIGEEEATF